MSYTGGPSKTMPKATVTTEALIMQKPYSRAVLIFSLMLTGSIPAFSAVDNLTVLHVTSTQMVIIYTAPSLAACGVEASVESDYTPLALDIDPAYFTDANLDSRTGNIVNGRSRIFVIGKQGAAAMAASLNGYNMSRALQADTEYFIRVTCGGDTATTRGRTGNIMFGSTRGEALAVSNAAIWAYDGVAGNTIANPSYADPYTGAKIRQPSTPFGWGYSMSTATGGSEGYIPGADCNVTISGVLGSCIFTSAAGTNWTASSGTLTDSIRADDGVFAQYSGTTQDKLFVRLGSGFGAEKIPTHSTYGGMLSFQNIIFRALTSSTTGDGEFMRTCFTADAATCASPAMRVTLTTSEATYRVCHTSPCAAPETPGDIMMSSGGGGLRLGLSRVYNTSGADTTIKFAGAQALAACNALVVGEIMLVYRSPTNGTSPDGLVIGSKNCGAGTPELTVNNTVDLSFNGTTGVTYFRFSGAHRFNPDFGILIWKESTTEASTISVDIALYRAATSVEFGYQVGSGGFGKRCQQVPTAGGYYLCLASSQSFPSTSLIYGIKPNASGEMDLAYYGQAQWRGDLYASGLSNSTYSTCSSVSTNDAMWDDAVPGVLYCMMPSTYPNPRAGGAVDGRNVLVKVTLTLSAPAASDPDGTSPGTRSSVAGANMVILTPCLSPCTATTDDFTPPEQRRRYSASYDDYQQSKFGVCGLEAVQALNVVEMCRSGQQDSHAWVFAYDLGDRDAVGGGFTGTHGNTQQIYAGFNIAGASPCRWCIMHTLQNPVSAGGSPFTIMETGDKCPLSVTLGTGMSSCTVNANGTGTCSACSNNSLDGTSYNGKNWCTNITVSSAWDGGWGSTPGTFSSGDPVTSGCANSPDLHWIQSTQVGDFLYMDGEYMRILSKASNTSWEVVRGWGFNSDSNYQPVAHTNGQQLYAFCSSRRRDPLSTIRPEDPIGTAWYMASDPGGTSDTYTFLTKFQNHGLNAINFGTTNKYIIGMYDFNDPASNKAALDAGGGTSLPTAFAGKSTECGGNACEYHPGAQQVAGSAIAKTWFADIHPRLVIASGTNAVALASGKTYIYQYNGTASTDFKHFDQEVFTGGYPFRRVDTLTDAPDDTGKWCAAIIANDCFSGSTAGKLYFVNDVFDTTFIALHTCRESQFGTVNGDFCAGNSNGAGASMMQWKLPPANTYIPDNGRAVSKINRSYREAATENAKTDPTGSALLTRAMWYVIPPSIPPTDNRNRATFTGVPVTIPSKVPPGTSTALVQFGYDVDFHCSTNRSNTCYAESATLSEATPFQFDHQTLTGVSCSSGCTIMIPALHNRVLYYRRVFRNAGGTIIHRGATEVLAIQ